MKSTNQLSHFVIATLTMSVLSRSLLVNMSHNELSGVRRRPTSGIAQWDLAASSSQHVVFQQRGLERLYFLSFLSRSVCGMLAGVALSDFNLVCFVSVQAARVPCSLTERRANSLQAEQRRLFYALRREL